MRLLTVGVSTDEVCGVRDHARLLDESLADGGANVEQAWWERRHNEPLGVWLRAAREQVAAERPDWILWHYSAFAYGWRGIPTLAPRAAAAFSDLGIPIVTVLHEIALPFGRDGLRGFTHATTQRLALRPVLRASSAGLVTVPERIRWLETRPWLPRRPLALLPVYSNLPAAAAVDSATPPAVGVFGFAHSTPNAGAVTDALARLASQAGETRLVLLGAPGPVGPHADAWRRAAANAGIGPALSFSGVLEPAELAAALAAVDVVVFADPAGPSSRKGTLAAALAAGKPVVAVDGPERWPALVEAGALELVAPTADALETAIAGLLGDPDRRARLGAHAAAFHAERLAPPVAARTVLELLGRVSR